MAVRMRLQEDAHSPFNARALDLTCTIRIYAAALAPSDRECGSACLKLRGDVRRQSDRRRAYYGARGYHYSEVTIVRDDIAIQ